MSYGFKKGLFLALAALCGVLVFYRYTGGAILDPTRVGWLMAGDPAQHWLGWQFFRGTPLWQWPLGRNYPFGMEVSSSIVYTDSIPLMAFLFKPFNAWLPEAFQYTGIWLLLCCLLQTVFGYLVALRLTGQAFYSLICALFFAIAPVYLFRMTGHFALSGHWLLLAGLYLYLAPRFQRYAWLLLLVLAAWVHAYLLAMTLAIWIAAMVRDWQLNRDTRGIALSLLAGALLLALAMEAAGYFTVRNGGQIADGFGLYRMDLFAPVNPGYAFFSKILRANNNDLTNLEGFNFLGLGMLLLLAYCLMEAIRGTTMAGARQALLREPYVLLALGLTVFALSNVVSLQGLTWFTYPLPDDVLAFANTFRASGRFFWPVYYGLMAWAMLLLWKRAGARALPILLLALGIQVWDMGGLRGYLVASLQQSHAQEVRLTQSPWSEVTTGYSSIIALQPEQLVPYWLPVGEFAATHGLNMNFGWFARMDQKAKRHQQLKLMDLAASLALDPHNLYLLAPGQCPGWRARLPAGFVCKTSDQGDLVFKPRDPS
ncbi:DUF6311 domain-containing protein [Pseudomonas oryzihabitans]|uniref:DUF6311 domain-containing protein n=1 Tax=Pseudomonas oryzihabitans TaxID=47885 RepID=UPI001DA258BD|nr:DUF6311 domain-containing protein [Pseudomonas oryzihabitans]HJE68699.1 DUF6311 domain-containing protein [Pseudomonas oryzihabitans]